MSTPCRRPYIHTMEDNTMEQLPSSNTPGTNQSRTIPPGARGQIVTSMLKWGGGLGMLAVLITSIIIGLLVVVPLSLNAHWDADPLLVLGFAAVTFGGLILGLAIALVDAWVLDRFLPALSSGKTQRSRAVFLASTMAVILV